MADPRNGHRSVSSTSFIPVPVATRPPSSLPTTISLPQLALQSQSPSRIPSNPSIQASPTVQNATPGSSKSTFRSFRNLLPFGSGKPQSPNTSITPKGRTLSLGRSAMADRKSIDRKVTQPLPKISSEFSPVVVIEGPTTKQNNNRDFLLPTINQEPISTRLSPLASPLELKNETELPRLPSSSSLTPDPPQLTLSPGIPLGDLSTIIESETSAVSITKHIPLLDESVDEGAKEEQLQLLSPRSRGASSRTPDSPETYAFDLSTSKLAEEVRDAMSQEDQKGDWLQGVVLDDLPTPPDVIGRQGRIHDVSFDLSALDPELAILLSPNRVAPPAIVQATKPVVSTSRSREDLRQDSTPSESSTRQPPSPAASETWSLARPSQDYSTPQYSPIRSRTSLTASTPSRSPSAVPRFSHPWRSTKTTRAESIDLSPGDVRSSTTRRPPLSPNALNEQGFLRRQNTGESHSRKSTSSRLGTPTRTSTLHYPPSSRPPLRHLTSSNPPWDADSVSPSSRASSSLGTAASRRQYGPRPSMDSEERSSFDHDRASPYRPRSMSESRASPGPTTTTYRSASASVARSGSSHGGPGPRTARLFRAAGLLPANDDDRFRRSPSERDFRQTAPSRSGYSEISRSSSSWGRTRTGTISETASVRDGTPFSASNSTAPTTVSASSLHHESEIQLLKDKHRLENDVLMSALSDSQQVNKVLREEMSGLRDRIQDLEDRNMDLLDQLRRPPPPPLPVNRYSSHDRISRKESMDTLYKRNRQPRLQPLFSPSEPSEKRHSASSLRERDVNANSLDPNSFLDGGSISKRSMRKHRLSVSSSVFQGPPSTMSMLNDDDDEEVPEDSAAFSAESPPPSPTLVFGKVQPRVVHAQGPSVSSSFAGSSPTTANFTVQDSPTSLRLLSDHEDHLGDMASLDLRGDFDDFDDFDDI